MTSALQTTLVGASLSMALCGPAGGQAGPPPAASLEDITACSLEGDVVFVVTGRDASARRYKYAWDAAIDALCNGKGFAIGTPVRSAAVRATTLAAAPAAAVAAAAGAGGTGMEFPAEARPLTGDDLARKVAGRIFNVELQNGLRWRLDYKTNGYLFVNVSNGGAASGPWRADGSRLCTHMRGSNASCNEVRELGARLYLKRDNGDIIVLDPQ